MPVVSQFLRKQTKRQINQNLMQQKAKLKKYKHICKQNQSKYKIRNHNLEAKEESDKILPEV